MGADRSSGITPQHSRFMKKKLIESGELTKEDIDKIHKKVNSILNEEFLASKDYVPKRRDWLSAYWLGFKSPEQISSVRNTGYAVCVCLFSLPL